MEPYEFIRHMADCIENILSYTEGLDYDAFVESGLTRDAVIRNLEVVGEAATHIRNRFPRFVEANRNIPWDEMIGMRNRLIHGYFSIDYQLVWKTLERDLPPLKPLLDELAKP